MLHQGDIVIIAFPYSNLTERKIRPAIVLSNSNFNQHKNVLLAGIYGKRQSCSIPLSNDDLSEGRLQKQSWISLQNTFAYEQRNIMQVIGRISNSKVKELRYEWINYF